MNLTPKQKEAVWLGVFTSAVGYLSVNNLPQSSDVMDVESVVYEAAKTANRTLDVIRNPRMRETEEALRGLDTL
jgi:hypothetical protein